MIRAAVLLGLAALAGCGGGDTFTVELAGTPAANVAALSAIDLADASDALPGLKVATALDGNRLTYTIPVLDRPSPPLRGADQRRAGEPAAVPENGLKAPVDLPYNGSP